MIIDRIVGMTFDEEDDVTRVVMRQEDLPPCPKCHGALTMGEWIGGLCVTCGSVIP